jgi:hypothetical protein
MDTDFPRRIYDEVKRLFPDDTVQTLVSRPTLLSSRQGAIDPVVRLIHTPTGIEITCDDFPSQTENYIAAAIRLRIACDQGHH